MGHVLAKQSIFSYGKNFQSKKEKKNCNFYNRNMVVIRTATNHVTLVSATAD